MNMYRQENFSSFTSRKKNKNYSGQIGINDKENPVWVGNEILFLCQWRLQSTYNLVDECCKGRLWNMTKDSRIKSVSQWAHSACDNASYQGWKPEFEPWEVNDWWSEQNLHAVLCPPCEFRGMWNSPHKILLQNKENFKLWSFHFFSTERKGQSSIVIMSFLFQNDNVISY